MYIGDHARTHPDKVAVAMWPSRRELTYRELYERSTRLANLFRSAGLAEGDHIAVFSYNHPGYYVAVWAGLNAGLYVTTVNAHSTVDEAAYVVNDCGAAALIVSDSTAAVAEELVGRTPGVRLRLSLEGTQGSYQGVDEATAAQPSEPTAPERRGTYMFYSSGTTGRPKGIKPPLPGGPASDGDAVVGDGMRRQFQIDESSVYLSPAPLHHAAPLRCSMVILDTGGTVVCLDRFDPTQALAAIEHHRVTVSQWVPTMFVRMLKLDPEVRHRYDLSSHGRAVHAAAPCPAWAKEQMIEWWGPIISEYYAGSENIGSTSIESDEWLAHRGSVGRAAFGAIHVCDPEGRELPPGQDGLVYFDLPTEFEYHGDPEKTASIRHPTEPWRTLGDIGHLDEEGYLYLSDRATFMIISGGANIYPREIEDVIIGHRGVADVAVFGVPDPDLGEVPLAAVQPADPDAPTDSLEAALRALCRARLARYKNPARYEFLESLPRGEDGKLRKKPLRDRYWGEDSKILKA